MYARGAYHLEFKSRLSMAGSTELANSACQHKSGRNIQNDTVRHGNLKSGLPLLLGSALFR